MGLVLSTSPAFMQYRGTIRSRCVIVMWRNLRSLHWTATSTPTPSFPLAYRIPHHFTQLSCVLCKRRRHSSSASCETRKMLTFNLVHLISHQSLLPAYHVCVAMIDCVKIWFFLTLSVLWRTPNRLFEPTTTFLTGMVVTLRSNIEYAAPIESTSMVP